MLEQEQEVCQGTQGGGEVHKEVCFLFAFLSNHLLQLAMNYEKHGDKFCLQSLPPVAFLIISNACSNFQGTTLEIYQKDWILIS